MSEHVNDHINNTNIFVINHFTRIETLLLPYHIFNQTRVPVWSLASAEFFGGTFGNLLDLVGAVSTKDPHRDRLIVKTLLTAEASWIVFPEGRMVKNKKILEKGRFMVSAPDGRKREPHTGAAALALRTEFYRQRFEKMRKKSPREIRRLMDLFGITESEIDPVLENRTRIVPVNVTYYPLRARENILSNLAERFVEGLDGAFLEELMTEGSMLLSGVDIDIRFGKAIDIRKRLCTDCVREDIETDREIGFDDLIPSRDTMRKISSELMNDYMSRIYDMTTVNHDHLFASVLKHYPWKRIKEADLKRRVYCVAKQGIERKGVYFHDSLQKDQLALLTDDRFDKYRDFISLAVEKKTVVKRDGTLIKNPEVFSTPFDFHRSRIDNTVAVIANEVEALKRFQRSVRICSWLPGFLLVEPLLLRLFAYSRISP